MTHARVAIYSAAIFACVCHGQIRSAEPSALAIVKPTDASRRQILAVRELRRYLYLRTGKLTPIVEQLPTSGDAIAIDAASGGLGPQEFHLATTSERGRKILHIAGGSDIGVLYGTYRFVEHLGVRFYLHGDLIPDRRLSDWRLPDLDERGKPLFEVRGIQPFHDFTEGPDWWEADDYKAHFSQLAKLRMNFLGLHCYPEGGVGPEPLIWIGPPEDMNEDGTVRHSYPSRWASTGGGAWGYGRTKTSDFAAGAGLIFEDDDFGPSVSRGYRPMPTTPDGCNEIFNRTAAMLRQAFAHGRSLGVQICVGTETPLTIPKAVRERLRQRGLDPQDPAAVQKLYEGMFRRIAAAYPIDYYWLWTPENWTWSGTKPEEVEATVRDTQLALQALAQAGSPFGFATSGWVLGPPSDRALFDKVLPKDAAVSCINRNVGFDWVEPGFAAVEGRQQWAIPWLEDDPAMIIPQLWVGRTRRDAADALAYGCTGLIGIHWRTKILAPNIAALAKAAWDQAGWNQSLGAGRSAAVGSKRPPDLPRDLSTDDFYADWASAQFGAEVAAPMAELFAKLDGGPGDYAADKDAAYLPRPADWIGGPGGIRPIERSWDDEKRRYAFVDEMAHWREKVRGAGNLARFDYWLNTFRYLRAVGQIGCTRGQLDQTVKQIDAEADVAKKKQLAESAALPLRIDLARQWEQMMTWQLAATDTPGEMGTIANLEMHVRRNSQVPHFLDLHDEKLAGILGETLPTAVQPSTRYTGTPRIIVPTKRSQIARGESLTIKIIVLDTDRPTQAALHWRPMGSGDWQKADLTHVARAVYTGTLPPANGTAIEYYVDATTAAGRTLAWPATAPTLNQTVVVVPHERHPLSTQ